MPYGERFRKHRRLMSQVLNSQAILVYRDFQVNNTNMLLQNMLREPEKFERHIFRFVPEACFLCVICDIFTRVPRQPSLYHGYPCYLRS